MLGSIYHPSSVDENDIIVCDDEDFALDYGICVGDRYYLFDKKLILSLTGDGASGVKNTPSDVFNMCIAYLKVFAFDYGLLQSRHAGIPVLLSQLPDSDDRITKYMNDISVSLDCAGQIAIFCNEYKCWFLFDYLKYSTGD